MDEEVHEEVAACNELAERTKDEVLKDCCCCTRVAVEEDEEDSFSGPVGDGGDLIDVLLHGA